MIIYMMGVLLIASQERFVFKDGVDIPVSMQNYVTRQETEEYWRVFLVNETYKILYEFYNMEESDIKVSHTAKVSLGDGGFVAADWVYKKYGVLNPRPTFIHTIIEDVEGYIVEGPPEWKDDVIFIPADFKRIEVELNVPFYERVTKPILTLCLTTFSTLKIPLFLGLGQPPEGPTQILNAKDHGIVGDGVIDDTEAIEAFFLNNTGCLFFPEGNYNVNQYRDRVYGGYQSPGGVQIHDNAIVVGVGDATVFVPMRDDLGVLGIVGNNVTCKDFKVQGTGVNPGGEQTGWGVSIMGAFTGVRIFNVTSNDFLGGTGLNGRGISPVGAIGAIIQDCRMYRNQHGIVGGQAGNSNPLTDCRVIACDCMDSKEKNYYTEGGGNTSKWIANIARGSGNGIFAYSDDTCNILFEGNTLIMGGNGVEPYGGSIGGRGQTYRKNLCQSQNTYGMYPQAEDCRFEGNIVSHCAQHGIYAFVRTQYCTFDSNKVMYNGGHGIYLFHQGNNTLSNNEIVNNEGGFGVYLRDSPDNTLISNTIRSSDTTLYHTSYGIVMDGGSPRTILRDNDLRSAGAQIFLDSTGTAIWEGNNQGI